LPGRWWQRLEFRDPFTESGRTEKKGLQTCGEKKKIIGIVQLDRDQKPNGKY